MRVLLALCLVTAACSKTEPTVKPTEVDAAAAPMDAAARVMGNDAGAVDAAVADAAMASPPWQPPVVPTRSAACGTARVVSQGQAFTTPSGRTFHVYGPSNYDANKAYPVSLTYHGWYATGPAFRDWFRMENAVKDDGFTVYPSSDGPLWDTSGQKDVEFFDAMMKMLGETFCINPANVLAFGFSHGGIFMSQLGCYRAGYVKAIAIGAGNTSGPDTGCGRLPVFLVSRTRDTDEPVGNGQNARRTWVARNSCSANTSTPDAMNCIEHQGCKVPGSVTWCEDTFYDPTWPAEWNHTVRDVYRAQVWKWFQGL